MYEIANELNLNQSNLTEKYEYLMQEPHQISNYLEECVNNDFDYCNISNDDNLILICKGYDPMSSHKHIHIEKVTCSICGDCVCRNCCYRDKQSKVVTCVPCYKNEILHGISGY